MPGKPIATLTSMHVCPLCSGTVPHVGGPITGPGAPTVLINGKPAALMGDMCVCVGPPDTIVQGNPAVLINGTPVACVGDMTAHGGVITVGDPTVMISTATPDTKVTMPLKQIPFPKINVLDDLGSAVVGKAKSHKQGKVNIEKIKKETEEREKKPRVHSLRWLDLDGNPLSDEDLKREKVRICASVIDIDDGESITIKVFKKTPEGELKGEVTGTVENGKVEVEWDLDKAHFEQNS